MGGEYHNVNIPTLINNNDIGKCQTQNSLLALFNLKYVRQTRNCRWSCTLLNWLGNGRSRLIFIPAI